MIKARLGQDFDRTVLRVFPFVARIRIHPDLLTLVGVGVSVAAGAAFAADARFAAGLLLMVAGFFDLTDGVVARIQGRSSVAGAFFDSTMDRASDLAIFGGILVGAAAHAAPGLALLTVWALASAVLTSYARARAECEVASLAGGFMERGERFAVLILGALTGFLEIALWVVALGATVTAVSRVWTARRVLLEFERTGVDPTAEAGGEA